MSIIGHGDIATVLKKVSLTKDKNYIFFASGVSNSQETREEEFMREKVLLFQQDFKKHLVYFSSIAVFWSDSPYFTHKQEMEELIKYNFKRYTIIRIGNITWGTNPHTLINFFKNRIKNNESIEIQPGYRYVVDKEEFLYWVNLIPYRSCELTIPGKRMRIIDIAKEYGYA